MKLFELLQLVIGKLNNAVSTDVQDLSDEQKAQAKANLGISENSEATISDWNQNDENAPDYVKNRTHYKSFSKDYEKRFFGWFDSSVLTTTQLEDGSYAWAEEKYVIPQSAIVKELTPRDFDDDMMSTNDDEWRIKTTVLVTTDLYKLSEKFMVTPEAILQSVEPWSQEVIITTPYFKITGPYEGQPNWYFVPTVPPTQHTIDILNGGKRGPFEVTKAKVTYEQLDIRYIPTKDTIYGGSAIPTSSAIIGALETMVYYENLQDRPFYHDEESYIAIYNSSEDIMGAEMVGTSPIDLPENHWEHYIFDGRTYRVLFKGNWYTCVCEYTDPEERYHRYLGNGSLYDESLPDTGEPFVVIRGLEGEASYLKFNVNDGEYNQAFVVEELSPEVLKKLDEKFIPDEIARVSDIPGACITDSELAALADLLGVTLEGETNTTQE
jgi:hypothetical protein